MQPPWDLTLGEVQKLTKDGRWDEDMGDIMRWCSVARAFVGLSTITQQKFWMMQLPRSPLLPQSQRQRSGSASSTTLTLGQLRLLVAYYRGTEIMKAHNLDVNFSVPIHDPGLDGGCCGTSNQAQQATCGRGMAHVVSNRRPRSWE
mmetsp:Transcript_11792/g.25180  ORF Transcript_11792/g.25180 Transcript_11792/m.25180 type:complete len:146 (+) Transcript_11792:1561-1998(+)